MQNLECREAVPTQTIRSKKIIRLSSEWNTSLEISKVVKRDHRTIKKMSAEEITHSKPKALSHKTCKKWLVLCERTPMQPLKPFMIRLAYKISLNKPEKTTEGRLLKLKKWKVLQF